MARGLAGIVVTGRDSNRGEAAARLFSDRGCKTIFVPADLTKQSDVCAITAACDAAFGRVDVLVNAAGNTDRGTILDTSEEIYDAVFAANVKAPSF